MTFTLYHGDCRDVLDLLVPANSVQTCITSPPYFGLRDYGVEGQRGLEATPDEYVTALVADFREVRRVLKADGTVWLNLGDSYANDSKWGGSSSGKHATALHGDSGIGRRRHLTGLKSKDLIGIPWRVAFALQADGWYLRQDIIWHKPNPMPESVTDRCTKAHEYLFLLSKSERYYWNRAAIQEPAVAGPPGNKSHRGADAFAAGDKHHATKTGLADYAARQRSKRDSFKRDASKRAAVHPGQTMGTHRPERPESDYPLTTRNKRSVWTVTTKPYKEAHFATFPPDLILPCVLAGSRPGDLVLDPFTGSGTTAQVALQNGRSFVGVELKAEYIELAKRRVNGFAYLDEDLA